MRNGLFFLVGVLLFLSCNNTADTPVPNSPQKQLNDSLTGNGKNQGPGNQNDSAAATDILSLEQAFNKNPSQENAFELAYAYAAAKNKKALWFTDTLLKYGRKEDVGFAWYAKAVYYQNTGDAQKALKLFDSSINVDYTFLDSYRDKGQLQYSLKQFNPALKTFAQGQSLSHDLSAKAEFIYWAAKCFEATGDKHNAKENYERAYAMDKTLVEAKEAAARL